MKLIIDCEASGPCPMFGDVISFGAVVVEPGLNRTYRSPDMKPTCDKWNEGAYRSIGLTRADHEAYTATVEEGFRDFHRWLTDMRLNRYVMVSDNPAFDWQWINWGFYHAGFDSNPFGHSARRIGDMWAGLTGKENNTSSWKKFRKTKHTHDPLDDSIGNAEAYLKIWNQQ